MSRADRFEFTLDEDTEKRLYELLTDMDTRNTDRFWIKDKHGYHAEYVKVRHGKWKQWDGYGFEDTYECTECGEPFVLIEGTPLQNEYNYCPHCGARMDKEREEEWD